MGLEKFQDEYVNADDPLSGKPFLSSDRLGRRQFGAIMWKNYILKSRHPLETLLEIISPLLFVSVILVFYYNFSDDVIKETLFATRTFHINQIANLTRQLVGPEESRSNQMEMISLILSILKYDGNRFIPSLDEYIWVQEALIAHLSAESTETLGEIQKKVLGNILGNILLPGKIHLTPDNESVRDFQRWLRKRYKFWDMRFGQIFATQNEAVEYSTRVNGERTWAVIHFNTLDPTKNEVDFTIRMNISSLPSTEHLFYEYPRGPSPEYHDYYYSGFLTLMNTVRLYSQQDFHVFNGKNAYKDAIENIIGETNDNQGPSNELSDEVNNILKRTGKIDEDYDIYNLDTPTDTMPSPEFDVVIDLLSEVSGINLDKYRNEIHKIPKSPQSSGLGGQWTSLFPSSHFRVHSYFRRFGWITGVILSSSIIFPVSRLIKCIVREKELRIKEMLKMMGLREWVFNMSWLVTYMILFFTQNLLVVILLRLTLFQITSFFVFMVFMCIYSLCMIALCFLISTFFNRSQLASMIGSVMFLLMCLPVYLFTFYPPHLWISLKKILMLLPPCAFSFGIDRFLVYEQSAISIEWRHVSEGAISLQDSFGMLVFDFFLYAVVAWYFDKVLPSKYGTHLSPFFIFSWSYWYSKLKRIVFSLCKWTKARDSVIQDSPASLSDQLATINNWNIDDPSVEINGLHKIYTRGEKVAVDNLSLDMYHNQISCILGTNGAGKSTTMSILTGLYQATRGDCVVYGYSINRDMVKIRRVLGVCPQHDVLYPDLTVYEHLYFFSIMKGLKEEYIENEVNKFMADMELMDKTYSRSKTLSGGQKRKLSVSIALIGGSKIVYLDEPTSGMDPHARRVTWEVLLRAKKGRTLILTTHYLDEADILGDQISIMKDGIIMCSGTSLSLKSKYGLGYKMTFAMKNPESNNDEIPRIIGKYVQDYKILSLCRGELSFQLPMGYSSSFGKLFEEIEKKKTELGVSSYGITMCSLEDVFLVIASETDGSNNQVGFSKVSETDHLSSKNKADAPMLNYKIKPNAWKQFSVMVNQRILLLRRDRVSCFQELMLPIIIVLFALLILSIEPKIEAKKLDLNFYTFYESNAVGGPTETLLVKPPFKLDVNVHNQDQSNESPTFRNPKLVSKCPTSTCLSHRILQDTYYSDFSNHSARQCAYVFNDKVYQNINIASLFGMAQPEHYLSDFVDILGLQEEFLTIMRLDQIASVQVSRLLNLSIGFNDLKEEERSLQEFLTNKRWPEEIKVGVENRFVKTLTGWIMTFSQFITETELAKNMFLSIEQSGSEPKINIRVEGLENFNSYLDWNYFERIFGENPNPLWNFLSLPYDEMIKSNKDLLKFRDYWLSDNGTEFMSIFLEDTNETKLWSDFQSYVTTERDIKYLDNATKDIELSNDIFGDFLCELNKAPSKNWCDFIDEYNVTLIDFFSFLKTRRDTYFSRENTSTKYSLGWSLEKGIKVKTIFDAIGLNPEYLVAQLREMPILKTFGTLTFGTLLGLNNLNVTFPSQMTTLFNASSPHSLPICSIAMSDTISKELQRKSNSSGGYFKLYNHPLPETQEEEIQQTVWIAFFAVLFTLLPFCYCPACYAYRIVSDRAIGAKHLLLANGMGIKTYWLSNFSCDVVSYSAVSVWTMIAFALVGAIDFDSRKSSISTGAFLLFWLNGLATIPMTYCLTFLFDEAASAQINTAVFNCMFGFVLLLTTVCLEMYGLADIAHTLQFICRFFPIFNLGEGLSTLTRESLYLQILPDQQPLDMYDWDILGKNLSWLTFLSLLYPLILIGIETFSTGHGLNILGIISRKPTKKLRKTVVIPNSKLEQEQEKVKSQVSSQGEEETNWKNSTLEALQLKSKSTDTSEVQSQGSFNRLETVSTGDSSCSLGASQSIQLIDLENNPITFDPKALYIKPTRKFDLYGTRKTKKNLKTADSFIFEEDEDVKLERIRAQYAKDDQLRLNQVRKVYNSGGKKRVAVRKLVMGVTKGECFGLLGTNGAGKTTTMKMITGECQPSEGCIEVCGYDVVNSLHKTRENMGYCPQFDALFPRLTAREHLHLFAKVKGIPSENLDNLVAELMQFTGLERYADIITSAYSGGNKRKLSLAIALIGNPKLVLLDEPSCGMDPYARRQMWNLIGKTMNEDRSVVLTTHSMEEAEALCSKVGIMVNGALRAVGAPQHLKSRFGNGYQVDFRTHTREQCTGVIKLMENKFEAEILERHGNQALLRFPSIGTSLSSLFEEFEKRKDVLGIQEYGVSQASLEQVFLQVATKSAPIIQP